MTEAPETIWAWEYGTSNTWNTNEPIKKLVENAAKYRRADMPPKVKVIMWTTLQNGVKTTILPVVGKFCRVKASENGTFLAMIQGEFERNFKTKAEAVEYVECYFESIILGCLE